MTFGNFCTNSAVNVAQQFSIYGNGKNRILFYHKTIEEVKEVGFLKLEKKAGS